MVFCVLCADQARPDTARWQPLFDGKTLSGWEPTKFKGRGEVRVENGEVHLRAGKPMTGITRTAPFPQIDYEVRFQAARIAGSDFFASLTFPVRESHATFVTGGWGGDIVGISSLDGWDASDNETRTYFKFEPGRWYRFRLQVTADRIRTWIDDTPIVNVPIAGRSISLRYGEIQLSAPFGFASYGTSGAIRNVEYRLIPSR